MTKEEFTKHLSTLSVDERYKIRPQKIISKRGKVYVYDEVNMEDWEIYSCYMPQYRNPYSSRSYRDKYRLFCDNDMLLWLYDHWFLPEYNTNDEDRR